eukprot:4363767-Alexandrium_andersonii.AAC.1
MLGADSRGRHRAGAGLGSRLGGRRARHCSGRGLRWDRQPNVARRRGSRLSRGSRGKHGTELRK